MESLGSRLIVRLLLPALLLSLFIGTGVAQSLPLMPVPSPSRIPSHLLSPSNPLGPSGSAYGPAAPDSIPLSSEMFRGILPSIPNLELGFLYNFGNNVRSGRLYADYLVPIGLGGNSVLFGEAHGEVQDFWKRPSLSSAAGTQSTAYNRTDLSLGGGYRRLIAKSAFLGVNAFYDTTRLYGKWYPSSGAGLEMVALTPGDGAIDLNVNWYGNLINRSELINAFRNRAGSWDIEAGVYQPLFNQALDLRLSGTAYTFNVGTAVYGWRTGAELTTRNGFFTFKYEYGHDRINGAYNTIGGFVNVGFSLENIVRGENPFVSPEPVFGSPRNLARLLSQKVRRNWHQPAAVVLARAGGTKQTPYFLFVLWDKTAVVSGVPFDQPQRVPLTDLTWSIASSGSVTANATSYAVIIVDPDKTLPPTIPVTLTPSTSPLITILVDPNAPLGPYTIPAALTDGTPNIVAVLTTFSGVPEAVAITLAGGSGTITIADVSTGTVTPLVVTVTAFP